MVPYFSLTLSKKAFWILLEEKIISITFFFALTGGCFFSGHLSTKRGRSSFRSEILTCCSRWEKRSIVGESGSKPTSGTFLGNDYHSNVVYFEGFWDAFGMFTRVPGF